MKVYFVTGKVTPEMLNKTSTADMGAVVQGERVSVTVLARDEASAIREASRVAVAREAFRSAKVIRL